MKHLFLSVALGCAACGPAFAQSENALTFAAVIEAQGCTLSFDADPSIFAGTGMEGYELEAAFEELLSLGLAQVQGNAAIVTTGACAEAVVQSEAPETLVATLRALWVRDCAVTEAQMMQVIAEVGDRETTMAHLRDLEAAQIVNISSEAGGAILAQRLCQANADGIESMAAQIPDFVAMAEANNITFEGSALGGAVLFVEWLAARDCVESDIEVINAFAAALDVPGFFIEVTVALIEAGVFVDEPGPLTLTPELCAGTPDIRRAAVRAALPRG